MLTDIGFKKHDVNPLDFRAIFLNGNVLWWDILPINVRADLNDFDQTPISIIKLA